MMRTNNRVADVFQAMIAAIVVLMANGAYGQTAPPFELDLDTPDVPAFSILGIAPTQIERPTTPKALALSLLSSSTDDSNLIPNKYAVIAAPFWMRPNSLTLAQYVRPNIHQSLAQTFTVSLATTPASTNTDIGFGFSTAPFAGHGSTGFAEALIALNVASVRYRAAERLATLIEGVVTSKSVSAVQPDALKTELQKFVDRPDPVVLKTALQQHYELVFKSVVIDAAQMGIVDAEAEATARTGALQDGRKALGAAVDGLFESDPLPLLAGPVGDLLRHIPAASSDDEPLRQARQIIAYRALAQLLPSIRTMRSAAEAAMRATVADVRDEDKMRVGPMLSFSAAMASRMPNDRFTDGRQLRWAVWAAPAYRSDRSHVDIIGVLKWIQRDAAEGSNLFDAGIRVIKQAGATAVGAEFLSRIDRSNDDTPTTQRLTANVDYKIAEKVFVTFSFGKDFADPSIGKPKGALVSILGLSLGLSKNPSVPSR
jgi:hypothetical protein